MSVQARRRTGRLHPVATCPPGDFVFMPTGEEFAENRSFRYLLPRFFGYIHDDFCPRLDIPINQVGKYQQPV